MSLLWPAVAPGAWGLRRLCRVPGGKCATGRTRGRSRGWSGQAAPMLACSSCSDHTGPVPRNGSDCNKARAPAIVVE